MNELVREIEEDIRRERIDRIWHSFGKLMVGVSVAIIMATIGVVIVQDQKRSNAMEQTTQLIKGIDRIHIENYKGAISVFNKLSGDASSPYYGLAMLRKAQAYKALGNEEAATSTYKMLAASDAVFGDLAKILASSDDSKPIEPRQGSPFYYSQAEARGWQLMREGKKDEAVTMFLTIFENPEAPATMRDRLSEVLQHLSPDMFGEKLKLLEKTPGHE